MNATPHRKTTDSPHRAREAAGDAQLRAPAALKCLCVFALALMLGGCGSAPTRAPVEREAGAAAHKPAAAVAAPRARRGGGYYQDDGPGDNPPANLDKIADAEPRLEPLVRAANNP